MDEDDEILDLFLEESLEHLEGIEDDLLAIEQAGAEIDVDQVNKVFRAMHTIKGGSSFFGLTKVKDLTHVAESILDRVRKCQLVPTPAIVESLLEAVDHLVAMINNPQGIDSYDIGGSLAKMKSVESGEGGEAASQVEEGQVEIFSKENELIFLVNNSDLLDCENKLKGGPNLYLLTYDLLKDVEEKGKQPQIVIEELVQLCYIVESKVDFEHVPDLENFVKVSLPFYVLVSTVLEPDMVFEFFDIEHGSITTFDDERRPVKEISPDKPTSSSAAGSVSGNELDDLAQALEGAASDLGSTSNDGDLVDKLLGSVKSENTLIKSPGTQPLPAVPVETKVASAKKVPAIAKKSSSSENLRVSISLLENLMSLAGELVLARNQLLQAAEHDEVISMKVASQQINMVTSQLQEAIMKTRMQPVGIVFNKFKRIVRDLCNDLGKDIELVIEGENVEMDKTIIESIGDPLTHIVRNSMDHGLETPQERINAGKSAKGTLNIKAFHEAGKVIVEIIDDGRGVNIEKVSEKALEAGIVTEQVLERMTDKEITNLIFKPGFSTADEVTEISGRGVGMDVVLTNLKQLGGVVDLNSRPGLGTHLKISLPLTLAIMPSLLVSVSDKTYAVPQVNLLQIVRVPVTEVREKIQHIGASLVLRFTDELIQVVRANDFLLDNPTPIDMEHESFGFTSPLHILVVSVGELKYGVVVDQTLDSPEIVVKPFGRHLKSLKFYAGATILGNGSIAPIFDIAGIATELNITHISQEDHDDDSQEKGDSKGELQKLLIVNNGTSERLAIPISNIVRIERVPAEKIKKVGTQVTYDYMGKSIALFRVEDVANISKAELDGQCSIVIFEALGRQLGLLVKEIVDSVEVIVEFDEATHRQAGIFGSAFINDHLTLLIDLFGVVAEQKPEWVEKTGVNVHKTDTSHTILVVDDSKFFVNQISSFIEESGYKTVLAMDGKEALAELRSGKDISLVLADIEMPVMDGFELIEEIRKDQGLKELPVIAVTSVSGDTAREKGMALGFNEYLIKLDREEILQSLKRYLYDKVTA
jgi:two-component system, chemotaxis family, sensor kinase CheA